MEKTIVFFRNIFFPLFALIFFTQSGETPDMNWEDHEKRETLRKQVIHSKQQFIAPIKAYLEIIKIEREMHTNQRKKKST